MAKIIENTSGRRLICMSVDDVISVVKEYQRIIKLPKSYEETRFLLAKEVFYLPEEV